MEAESSVLRERAVVKLEKLDKDKSKRTIRLTPGTELISQLTIGLWDEHQPGAAGSASEGWSTGKMIRVGSEDSSPA